MGDLNTKISFCPVCGKRLIRIKDTFKNKEYTLCSDSSCRTYILGTTISTFSIYEFSRLADSIEKAKFKESNMKTYMLLKTTLSGPMLQKVTNNFDEKDKSMYCIVQAKDRDDALEKFSRRFSVIKIKPDMVVEVTIKEII